LVRIAKEFIQKKKIVEENGEERNGKMRRRKIVNSDCVGERESEREKREKK
jgi:hypothetical protein